MKERLMAWGIAALTFFSGIYAFELFINMRFAAVFAQGSYAYPIIFGFIFLMGTFIRLLGTTMKGSYQILGNGLSLGGKLINRWLLLCILITVVIPLNFTLGAGNRTTLLFFWPAEAMISLGDLIVEMGLLPIIGGVLVLAALVAFWLLRKAKKPGMDKSSKSGGPKKPMKRVKQTSTAAVMDDVAITEPKKEPTPEPPAEPRKEPTPEPTPEPKEEPTPEPPPEPTPEPKDEPTPGSPAEPKDEFPIEPKNERKTASKKAVKRQAATEEQPKKRAKPVPMTRRRQSVKSKETAMKVSAK